MGGCISAWLASNGWDQSTGVSIVSKKALNVLSTDLGPTASMAHKA